MQAEHWKKLYKDRNHSVWNLGNEYLYDLCKEHPKHIHDDEIIAKVWLIGRAYAVALERRKEKTADESNEEFYAKRIVPSFKKIGLDERIKKLRKHQRLEWENLEDVLRLHFYLSKKLAKITKQTNRSFNSKYLHFHMPELFLIYDSRAQNALNALKFSREYQTPDRVRKLIQSKSKKIDLSYAKFCVKCLHFRSVVEEQKKEKISLRMLDNILLAIS